MDTTLCSNSAARAGRQLALVSAGNSIVLTITSLLLLSSGPSKVKPSTYSVFNRCRSTPVEYRISSSPGFLMLASQLSTEFVLFVFIDEDC